MIRSQPNEIRKTEGFGEWIRGLKDTQARNRIHIRLKRLGQGPTGDAKSVGLGVWELRFHFGPGYRVYFTRVDDRIIFLLAGGDKATQERDIATAIELARSLRKER